MLHLEKNLPPPSLVHRLGQGFSKPVSQGPGLTPQHPQHLGSGTLGSSLRRWWSLVCPRPSHHLWLRIIRDRGGVFLDIQDDRGKGGGRRNPGWGWPSFHTHEQAHARDIHREHERAVALKWTGNSFVSSTKGEMLPSKVRTSLSMES